MQQDIVLILNRFKFERRKSINTPQKKTNIQHKNENNIIF